MRFILLFVVVVFCFSSFAQGLEGSDANFNLGSAETNMFRSFDNRHQGLKGYPTLYERFVTGDVYLFNGASAKNIRINYDAFTGELLMMTESTNKIMVLRSESVKSFTLKDESGQGTQFVNVPGAGFYEPVHEGRNSLYIRHEKRVEKANYGGAYNYNARLHDEFVGETSYYLKMGNGKPEKFKLNKKSIQAAYNSQSSQVKAYFKEKKPDLGNKDHVKALFQHLDALPGA
jgi:hypothetical protein